MKKGILIGAALALSSLSSIACDINGTTGFMPKNNLWISTSDKASNGMTEQRFNDIISRVEAVYKPIVEAKGKQFEVVRNWTDGTVNAYANQSGDTWYVNMFGGLARHELVTDDGFMMVVCHETGHHLGGAPRYNGTEWASNEGQSDYFASLKCMRKILENDDNISIVAGMKIDADAKTKCDLVYKSAAESALCQRIAMAGKSLAMLLGDLGGNSRVAFNTPDKKAVKRTNDNHPQAQCRLDTYFQGGLCDKSHNEEVSSTDTKPGTCIKSEGYSIGTRPLCWYKPGTGE